MSVPEPPRLSAFGQALWDRVTGEVRLDAAGYYVLAEACRTADIIDRLSGALRAGSTTWVRLADEVGQVVDGNTMEVNIVVNPLLGEIRQQRLTLRQLLAQLKLGNVVVDTEEVSALDRLIADFNTPD